MKRLTRSQTFLLELTINLLVFCVCAAICLTLLARAHKLSIESGELGHAVIAAECAAEAFKAANGDMDAATLQYDDNWAETEQNPVYTLDIAPQDAENGLQDAQITVRRTADEQVLYALSVTHFFGEVGA